MTGNRFICDDMCVQDIATWTFILMPDGTPMAIPAGKSKVSAYLCGKCDNIHLQIGNDARKDIALQLTLPPESAEKLADLLYNPRTVKTDD